MRADSHSQPMTLLRNNLVLNLFPQPNKARVVSRHAHKQIAICVGMLLRLAQRVRVLAVKIGLRISGNVKTSQPET